MSKQAWPLWQRQLLLLWIGQFAVTLGLTGMTPFLLFHMQELLGGAHEDAVWWTSVALAVPSAAYMVTTPLWGKLGDRVRRKWMVVRALGGIGFCMAGMALAPTAGLFLLFRLLQGALGGIYDAATAMLAVSAPPERKGEALGRYQQAVIAGSLAGPLIGGWFVGRIGSDAFLLGAAVLTLLSGAACALLLPDEEAKRQSEEARSAAQSEGVWRCLRSFWQDREARSVLTAGVLARAMSAGGVALLPIVLWQAYPEEGARLAESIGWMEALASLGALYGAARFGKAGDRGNGPRLLYLALLLCALSMGLQAILPVIAIVLVLKLIQGFAYSAVQPLVMRTMLARAREGGQGMQIGTVNSLLVVGQLVGSLLPLAVLPAVSASTGLLLTALLPLAGALLLRLGINKSLRRRKEANYAG
jgi:MFS transporter, DHA1 family, staphyloferrin B biosynthesis exporter